MVGSAAAMRSSSGYRRQGAAAEAGELHLGGRRPHDAEHRHADEHRVLRQRLGRRAFEHRTEAPTLLQSTHGPAVENHRGKRREHAGSGGRSQPHAPAGEQHDTENHLDGGHQHGHREAQNRGHTVRRQRPEKGPGVGHLEGTGEDEHQADTNGGDTSHRLLPIARRLPSAGLLRRLRRRRRGVGGARGAALLVAFLVALASHGSCAGPGANGSVTGRTTARGEERLRIAPRGEPNGTKTVSRYSEA